MIYLFKLIYLLRQDFNLGPLNLNVTISAMLLLYNYLLGFIALDKRNNLGSANSTSIFRNIMNNYLGELSNEFSTNSSSSVIRMSSNHKKVTNAAHIGKDFPKLLFVKQGCVIIR